MIQQPQTRPENHQPRVPTRIGGSPTFGWMPFIGSRLHEAYDEHVTEVEEAIEQVQLALQGACGATAMSAAEWLAVELL